jgi:hypothetical protein
MHGVQRRFLSTCNNEQQCCCCSACLPGQDSVGHSSVVTCGTAVRQWLLSEAGSLYFYAAQHDSGADTSAAAPVKP